MTYKADVRAVMGSTGSGKTLCIRAMLKKIKKPKLIWDFNGEYNGPWTDSIAYLLQIDKFKMISFRPSHDRDIRDREFHLFCRFAHDRGHVCVVVDELHFVTSPHRAPASWSMLTCTGRHKGLTVIGSSQRPAHIDKDFLGNCTERVSFRLSDFADAQVAAKSMNIKPERLQSLVTDGRQCRGLRYQDGRINEITLNIPA